MHKRTKDKAHLLAMKDKRNELSSSSIILKRKKGNGRLVVEDAIVVTLFVIMEAHTTRQQVNRLYQDNTF